VQVEPTSSAAQVARHAANAAVQEWRPLAPEDQTDTAYRTGDQVSGGPVCKWYEAPAATTACEGRRSCTTCPTAEMHATSNVHAYNHFHLNIGIPHNSISHDLSCRSS